MRGKVEYSTGTLEIKCQLLPVNPAKSNCRVTPTPLGSCTSGQSTMIIHKAFRRDKFNQLHFAIVHMYMAFCVD